MDHDKVRGNDVKIMITLHDNGAITINGPIDNKVLVYGMIEAAKDAVRDYHLNKKVESRIQVAGVPPFPLKGN